jgi:sporulation protein, YlmC/YmxH family
VIILTCRIVDLRNKEVINVKDGSRIGCVNDVEVDIKCARVVSIVIYGRLKLFGILGREEDIVIRWENIEVVGEDTILVKYSPTIRKRKKLKIFNKLFFN